LGSVSLADIVVTPLSTAPAEGGAVMHIMKNTCAGYADFGEAYFSWVGAGSVKAWKRHKQMVMNLVVPVGRVKFVFWLESTNEFKEQKVGFDHYSRLTVPPGIWFGFQGLVVPQSLILNIGSIPHDPNEVDRLAISQIKYDWN